MSTHPLSLRPGIALRRLLAITALAVATATCGAKTSLPLDDQEELPEPRPEPGGSLAITDPQGETTEYLLFETELECTSFEGGAYRIHFAINNLVGTVQFLPYDGPGEFTSDNVRVQGDGEARPQCVGPCVEVDLRDGNTVVASGSNATCVVFAEVDDAFADLDLECEGNVGSNGAGFVTTADITCAVLRDP